MNKIKGMNKHAATMGSEFVLWFFRFILLILALIGIVLIVTILFKTKIDIREAEAGLLGEKLFACLAENGRLDLSNLNDATIKNCVNFNEEMFVKLSLSALEKEISAGNSNIDELCAMAKKGILKYAPACIEKNYYVIADGKPATLYMLTAIKKIEKNL